MTSDLTPPYLIDTHCHFDFLPFTGNELASLQLAHAKGIGAIIVPSVTAERLQIVTELSQQYQAIYAALGLHPIYIEQHNQLAIEKLHNSLKDRSNKVIAIGEIGLDNFIAEPQLERQIVLLQEQFQLAKQHQLPVILHSRKSHDLLAKQLKQANLARTGVVHGFAGSLEQAQRFIQLGYYIGVGGVITYPRAQKTRKAIAALPLEWLLLETDAPDMPVYGHQGQPNRPERLAEIVQVLSIIRAEPVADIINQIYQNTCRLFNLPF